MLKQSFGDRQWQTQEFPLNGDPIAILSGRANAQLVEDWLATHQKVVVLSSHTAVMPLPKLPATRIYPIIMVRNPLIRLQSSWQYQRAQFDSGHTKGTGLAGQNDLAEYLRILLARNRASNFASVRLAAAVPGTPDQIRKRALEAVKRLPFVGVVEFFERSLWVLKRWLEPHFPELNVVSAWENRSPLADKPLNDRLADMRNEIGEDLYNKVLAANRIDLELHELASKKILQPP